MTTEVFANESWMLVSTALVLLMTPALALFYGGMSRQKSVLNMMMMSFGFLGVVTAIYVLWGWSMSYGTHDIFGLFSNPFEFIGVRNSIGNAEGPVISKYGYPNVIEIGYQLTFAVIACALISSALAELVKFRHLDGLHRTVVHLRVFPARTHDLRRRYSFRACA